MSEGKQRIKNRYFAVVNKQFADEVKEGHADSYSHRVVALEFDTQNDLKKALADDDVLEILSITKGRRVSFKETRAIQLTIGE